MNNAQKTIDEYRALMAEFGGETLFGLMRRCAAERARAEKAEATLAAVRAELVEFMAMYGSEFDFTATIAAIDAKVERGWVAPEVAARLAAALRRIEPMCDGSHENCGTCRVIADYNKAR